MMKIEKITNKVNLDGVVTAEGKYECMHDCIEYYWSGKTAAKGCKRKHKVTARTTKRL